MEEGFESLNCILTGTDFSEVSTTNTHGTNRSLVPGTMIERFGLRQGVYVKAMVQEARRQQGPRVREILMSMDQAEDYPEVKSFDTLTPVNPEEWLYLKPVRSHSRIE